MAQQSIVLRPELVAKIDDIRSNTRPITSRNALINALVAEALAAREAK